MNRSKYKPSTRPVGKIKLIFYDQTEESDSSYKFVKMCPEQIKISELPSLCLKDCSDPSAIEIYINDELVLNEDLNKPLLKFGTSPVAKFKSKQGNYFILYSLKNIKGEEIKYTANKKQNFLKLFDIDEETDTYFIFDKEGKETTITNDNFKEKVKNGDNFYLINYPKKIDTLSPPELFDEISGSLNTTPADFRKLLCILYIFCHDKDIYEKINIQLNLDKKYVLLYTLAKNFFKKPNEKKTFIKFIFTLPFVKKKRETYSELFERLYEDIVVDKSVKPFSIFDSKEFAYKSKIEENTIIQTSKDTFGIYKNSAEPGFYKVFDPYVNKEILKSIDYSDIENPGQITAIFVDTSGSMLASFNHTRHKLFEVAVEIANDIISNIHKFNIYDSIIVATSFADILKPERIPLNIDKSELNGKTNIWDKINSFIKEIKKRKGKKNYPSHIIIISDGEDTNSKKTREDILSEIQKEKIIVDSIILCDDNYTQDSSIISTYTNGVYLFVNDIKEAKEFISKEPFFDLSIRKPIKSKSLPKFPFKKNKHYKVFEQLEPFYCNVNNTSFYYDFEYGLLKPSPDKFKKNESILAKEFLECLEKEKENPQYFTFLIQNRDFDDDDDKDDKDDDDDDSDDIDEDYFPKKKTKKVKNKYAEMLNHWCVFIKFDNGKEKKPYFWQMEINFDSKYPVSLPTMRIISHPELISQNQELISEFGTVIFNKLIKSLEKHYTVSELLDKLIKKIKVKFEYKKFEYDYVNSPTSVINASLTKKINIKFEDGWGNDVDDDEMEEEEEEKATKEVTIKAIDKINDKSDSDDKPEEEIEEKGKIKEKEEENTEEENDKENEEDKEKEKERKKKEKEEREKKEKEEKERKKKEKEEREKKEKEEKERKKREKEEEEKERKRREKELKKKKKDSKGSKDVASEAQSSEIPSSEILSSDNLSSDNPATPKEYKHRHGSKSLRPSSSKDKKSSKS